MKQLFHVESSGAFSALAEYQDAFKKSNQRVKERLADAAARVNSCQVAGDCFSLGRPWTEKSIYKLRVAPFELFVLCAPGNDVETQIIYVVKTMGAAVSLVAETDEAKRRRAMILGAGKE